MRCYPYIQYELATLNSDEHVPRRTWLRVWASLSDPFHPHSQQECDAYLAQEE